MLVSLVDVPTRLGHDTLETEFYLVAICDALAQADPSFFVNLLQPSLLVRPERLADLAASLVAGPFVKCKNVSVQQLTYFLTKQLGQGPYRKLLKLFNFASFDLEDNPKREMEQQRRQTLQHLIDFVTRGTFGVWHVCDIVRVLRVRDGVSQMVCPTAPLS